MAIKPHHASPIPSREQRKKEWLIFVVVCIYTVVKRYYGIYLIGCGCGWNY